MFAAIIATVIGEGGSGGALALGRADDVAQAAVVEGAHDEDGQARHRQQCPQAVADGIGDFFAEVWGG